MLTVVSLTCSYPISYFLPPLWRPPVRSSPSKFTEPLCLSLPIDWLNARHKPSPRRSKSLRSSTLERFFHRSHSIWTSRQCSSNSIPPNNKFSRSLSETRVIMSTFKSPQIINCRLTCRLRYCNINPQKFSTQSRVLYSVGRALQHTRIF